MMQVVLRWPDATQVAARAAYIRDMLANFQWQLRTVLSSGNVCRKPLLALILRQGQCWF